MGRRSLPLTLPPVMEVLRDGVNGRAVAFFDTGAITEAVLNCLAGDISGVARCLKARHDVQAYDYMCAISAYESLLRKTLAFPSHAAPPDPDLAASPRYAQKDASKHDSLTAQHRTLAPASAASVTIDRTETSL
jgi:hypothetical protein